MPGPERPHERRSLAYVLSLWREGADTPWRAALRPVDGGERRGFAGLEQLAAFLLQLNEERAPPGEGETRPPARRPSPDGSAWAGTVGKDDDDHGV